MSIQFPIWILLATLMLGCMSPPLVTERFGPFGMLSVEPDHLGLYHEFSAAHWPLEERKREIGDLEESQCQLAERYAARMPAPTMPGADSLVPVMALIRANECAAHDRREIAVRWAESIGAYLQQFEAVSDARP